MLFNQLERFIKFLDFDVAEPLADASVDSRLIDFDNQNRSTGHRSGQWLSATHTAHPTGENPPSGKVSAEVFGGSGRECFVGPLDNSLRANVNPAAGRHLAVHDQAEFLQLPEFFPGRPGGDQVGIGYQNPGGIFMRPEYPDRFAGLHEQRLVVVQRLK